MHGKFGVAAMAVILGGALASCSTDGVSGLTASGATLNGTVRGASATSYTFQYAASPAALGTSGDTETARGSVPAGAPAHVSARLTGIGPTGMSTFFRLCAREAGEKADTCYGTRQFSTPPAGTQRAMFDEIGGATFTVPGGVRAVAVDASGAAGGAVDDVSGGKGGREQAIFTVHPGDRLVVRTGSAGGDANDATGYDGSNHLGGRGGSNGTDQGGNGGSGDGSAAAGGGAPSRIDLIPAGSEAATTILVAGAGGGAGGVTSRDPSLPPDGPTTTPGGAGGGTVGGAGAGQAPGAGGTASAPGSESVTGFDGGHGLSVYLWSPLDLILGGRGGGGGGGGHYGGAGGGGAYYQNARDNNLPPPHVGKSTGVAPSSGGGGASWTKAGVAVGTSGHVELGPVTEGGTQAGNGIVTLTWTIPAS